jgi:hypothetical protein
VSFSGRGQVLHQVPSCPALFSCQALHQIYPVAQRAVPCSSVSGQVLHHFPQYHSVTVAKRCPDQALDRTAHTQPHDHSSPQWPLSNAAMMTLFSRNAATRLHRVQALYPFNSWKVAQKNKCIAPVHHTQPSGLPFSCITLNPYWNGNWTEQWTQIQPLVKSGAIVRSFSRWCEAHMPLASLLTSEPLLHVRLISSRHMFAQPMGLSTRRDGFKTGFDAR